jgi:hypothetical protein
MPISRSSRIISANERGNQGIVLPKQSVPAVAGQLYTPLSLDQLLWWGDANTINKNPGQPVGVLEDSFRNYDVIQNTGSKQPTFQIVSERPWLLFDGVDDLLKVTLPNTTTGPHTLFSVVRRLSNQAGNAKHVALTSDGAVSQYWALATQAYGSGVGGNNVQGGLSGSALNNTTCVVITLFDTTNSYLRVNGVSLTGWSPGFPAAIFCNCISLGSNFAENEWSNVLIGEVGLVGKALSATELSQLENSLKRKWAANF